MSDPRVTVVDIGAASAASVVRAFLRLGADVDLTSDLDRVADARRVVLPGASGFGPGMARLLETGLEAAVRAALHRGGNLLGVSLGCQLLFEESAEEGRPKGLGLLGGRVAPFPYGVRTPHAGWNRLRPARADGSVAGLHDGTFVYFVHGLRAEGVDERDVAATCDHGGDFPAVVQRERVWGFQFQPEKSSEAGRQLLANFLKEGAA